MRGARSRAAMARVVLLSAALALAAVGCASPPRLIDQDAATGFAIYRSGWLSRTQLAALCSSGVEEMVVLDGTATKRECRMRDEICPRLRIRYDEKQDPRVPVDTDFLDAFDAWVEEARSEGRVIAFRCRHGWHRAGRLAAWYRMRFGNWPVEEAIAEMLDTGRFMNRHRQLVTEARAMGDCPTRADCRQALGDRPESAATAGFDDDLCERPET